MLNSDVIVVGGGIVGCSAAMFLADAGMDVNLLDRGEISGEASGLNAGSIGGYGWGRSPSLQEHLTMGSLDIFKSLQIEKGYDIEFRQSGSLVAIQSLNQYEYAQERVSYLKSEGMQVEILSPSEAKSYEPNLNGDLNGYMYSSYRGQADPIKSTRAFSEVAKNNGAIITASAPVTSLEQAGQGWIVRSHNRVFNCQALLIATGAWTSEIGNMIGLNIPIQPVRGQMWATDSIPPRIFHTISSMESSEYWHKNPIVNEDSPPELTHNGDSRVTRHLYGRQRANGEVIFGGDRELLGFRDDVSFAGIEVNKTHAGEILPFLDELSVKRTWSGIMPFSPDGLPLIGRIEQYENLFLATGLGSSGFGRGPGSGMLVADLIVRGEGHPALQESIPTRLIEEIRR
ncbi:MAG: FAD-binding oxidoreductase [Chloroflexota bacterium]|nr:FAD-binding oxidoreductase [Chloroflexota bacterium]